MDWTTVNDASQLFELVGHTKITPLGGINEAI